MKSKAQMANPPNPPLLKGGEGGLLIGFGIWHSFDICLPALYQHGSGPAAGRDFEISTQIVSSYDKGIHAGND